MEMAARDPSNYLSKGEIDTRNLKWVLLGIYLILAGLGLLGVQIGGNLIDLIAGICAIVAGVLFLINR